MKLLFVSTFAFPDHFGGAERVITEVATRLAQRGHTVTLLTGQVGDTAAREHRHGVEVVRYPVRPGRPDRFYRSVWSGVRKALAQGVGADADVLSVHQVLSAVAALAPGGARCPGRVCSFYAPYSLEYLARFRGGAETGSAPLAARAVSSVLARADRYVLRRSDEVLVLSDYSRQQIDTLYPPALERTTIAPAGVDLDHFRPAANEAERRACASAVGLGHVTAPIILSVRRLVPRMGLTDLLDAAARLLSDGRQLHLAIAGDGEQREELKQHAHHLGLGDRVSFLGRVPDDDLPALYRAADVFVLPTRSLEGFGMVTAEALASGLAVVATNAGASGEVLAEVSGSQLVPPSQPGALAEALATWLDVPEALQTARAATRAHAEKQLSWDVHLDAFEAAAERSLARNS
ncbi:MAG: glycosyltransferase involved in cell wall biosynthesis [Pseudohongiellaceae bacterium]|jgi:glycosyltransferase involved in cell wall biosynthesis